MLTLTHIHTYILTGLLIYAYEYIHPYIPNAYIHTHPSTRARTHTHTHKHTHTSGALWDFIMVVLELRFLYDYSEGFN
jgi:hypothetical protein